MEKLKSLNGLNVPVDYFPQAMERLRDVFLRMTPSGMIHPVSPVGSNAAKEHRAKANAAETVSKESLRSEATLERTARDNVKPRILSANPAALGFFVKTAIFLDGVEIARGNARNMSTMTTTTVGPHSLLDVAIVGSTKPGELDFGKNSPPNVSFPDPGVYEVAFYCEIWGGGTMKGPTKLS